METNHLQDPGVDGRVILKWIFKKRHGEMECFGLAQNRDRWWALVKSVMNLQIP